MKTTLRALLRRLVQLLTWLILLILLLSLRGDSRVPRLPGPHVPSPAPLFPNPQQGMGTPHLQTRVIKPKLVSREKRHRRTSAPGNIVVKWWNAVGKITMW